MDSDRDTDSLKLAKGMIEETVGKLTGSETLKARGKADQIEARHKTTAPAGDAFSAANTMPSWISRMSPGWRRMPAK